MFRVWNVQNAVTVFTDEVAKRLDDIVKTVSSLMTEIAVVEYTSDKVA